jgi:hypothetical protein
VSRGLDGVTFKKDNAEWKNAERIFYHGLAFTFNLDKGYSNKDLMFSSIGAMKIKYWVWQTPRHETLTMFNHGLGKTLPSLLS